MDEHRRERVLRLSGRRSMKVSPGQLRALAAYARTGDQHRAAEALGVSYHTVRNQLLYAYAKLGASSAIDAFRELGWLAVPDSLTGESSRR